jgi:hypothetical protein
MDTSKEVNGARRRRRHRPERARLRQGPEPHARASLLPLPNMGCRPSMPSLELRTAATRPRPPTQGNRVALLLSTTGQRRRWSSARATTAPTTRSCGARIVIGPPPPKDPPVAPTRADRAQRGPDPATGGLHPLAAGRSRWAGPSRPSPRQGHRRAGTSMLAPAGRRPSKAVGV